MGHLFNTVPAACVLTRLLLMLRWYYSLSKNTKPFLTYIWGFLPIMSQHDEGDTSDQITCYPSDMIMPCWCEDRTHMLKKSSCSKVHHVLCHETNRPLTHLWMFWLLSLKVLINNVMRKWHTNSHTIPRTITNKGVSFWTPSANTVKTTETSSACRYFKWMVITTEDFEVDIMLITLVQWSIRPDCITKQVKYLKTSHGVFVDIGNDSTASSKKKKIRSFTGGGSL